MFSKKTVRDIDVEDKIVLVRTDYNVPLVPVEAGELENEPLHPTKRHQIPTRL